MNSSHRTGTAWTLSCTGSVDMESLTYDPRTGVFEARVHTYELPGCPRVSGHVQ